MPRIPPTALLWALVILTSSIGSAPAFLLKAPALARWAPMASRAAVCMSSPAFGASNNAQSGRVKLQELLRSLRKPTRPETRTDPLNAVSCYLDRSAKIRSDVEELAMHLAAERSLQCSSGASGDAACDLASGANLHGRWKLEYSTDVYLQAASGLAEIRQELRASDKAGGGTVIRSSWGGAGERQFALEGDILKQPAPTKFPYVFRRSVVSIAPWLHLPLPAVSPGGYFSVLFSDGAVRVDWSDSGAINVYSALPDAGEKVQEEPVWSSMPAQSLATSIVAQVGGFIGADMRRDALGGWLADWRDRGQDAQSRAMQSFEPRLARKVPGIKFDRLTEKIKPWALGLALVLASSTGASAATQLMAEDPVAAAALVEPRGISDGVAVALVAPLIAYRLAALVKGEKLLPQLEFVILASVCALVIRVSGLS